MTSDHDPSLGPLPSDIFSDPAEPMTVFDRRLIELHRTYDLNTEEKCAAHLEFIRNSIDPRLGHETTRMISDFLRFERIHAPIYLPPPLKKVNDESWLRLQINHHYIANADFIAEATKRTIELFSNLLQIVPPISMVKGTPSTLYADHLDDVLPTFIQQLYHAITQLRWGFNNNFLFPAHVLRLNGNILDTNNQRLEAAVHNQTIKYVLPPKSKLVGQKAVRQLLVGTAFHDWLLRPVPFKEQPAPQMPRNLKFEHTWILAGSGAGKTTLLLKEIVENLKQPDPPAMVIIDPKGTILSRLSKLACFDPDTGLHKNRLVICDPSDVVYPPAMNMFHPGNEKRFRMYSESTRRQIENQTISLFAYIFNSQKIKLTGKQAPAFNYLVRLLFTIPNASIHTMLDIVNDEATTLAQSRWAPYIARLTPTAQRWFKDSFYHKTEYKETRNQISTRIFSLLEKPELDSMFSTTERKIDVFDILQNRKTLIVSLPKSLLGQEGMELIGRYMIALTLAAAFERISIPDRSKWTPAFIYIDEAHEFADEEKMPELLQLAREFNLGVTVAHQDIESQLSNALSSTLAANTSTKYVSSLGGRDANFMAREMHCEPSLIANAVKSGNTANFLCYMRGYLPQPINVSFPLGAIDREPQMSQAAHEKLIANNRALVSVPAAPPAPGPDLRALSAPAPRLQKHSPPRDPGDPSADY